MGETDLHRQDMMDVIATLHVHFAARPDVYVSGNLLRYYERGNKRKQVSPDAFVVLGVPKFPPRDYHPLWEEGKSPDVVIEITSKTTRREDQKKKLTLYRDVLKVPEYFQFNPREDYLKPPMQGHRLMDGEYVPIAPVDGHLSSESLGLHLEREGAELRLYDPATGRRLLSTREHAEEAEKRRAEADRQRIEADRQRVEADQRAATAESENERLRREIDDLKRRLGKQ
jgi:Uma2 family endonuclease